MKAKKLKQISALPPQVKSRIKPGASGWYLTEHCGLPTLVVKYADGGRQRIPVRNTIPKRQREAYEELNLRRTFVRDLPPNVRDLVPVKKRLDIVRFSVNEERTIVFLRGGGRYIQKQGQAKAAYLPPPGRLNL